MTRIMRNGRTGVDPKVFDVDEDATVRFRFRGDRMVRLLLQAQDPKNSNNWCNINDVHRTLIIEVNSNSTIKLVLDGVFDEDGYTGDNKVQGSVYGISKLYRGGDGKIKREPLPDHERSDTSWGTERNFANLGLNGSKWTTVAFTAVVKLNEAAGGRTFSGDPLVILVPKRN